MARGGGLSVSISPFVKKNTRRVYPDRVFPWDAVNQTTIARDAVHGAAKKIEWLEWRGETTRVSFDFLLRSINYNAYNLCVNLHSEPTRKMDRAIGCLRYLHGEKWQVKLWSMIIHFSRDHFPFLFSYSFLIRNDKAPSQMCTTILFTSVIILTLQIF